MKAKLKKLINSGFVFLMVSMAGMSAHADDTEIFFGGALNSAIKPNILFILDTSGSMGSYDRTSETRLQRMKSAFNTLLGNMNNVNVGIMRFNDPGGPILYPVRDIDASLDLSSFSGVTNARTTSTDNDGEENIGTTSVSLSKTSLAMGTRVSEPPGSISVSVTSGNDDVEERLSDGYLEYINSGSLELSFDDNNFSDQQMVGMIFRNINLPANAVITNASIDFTVYYKGNTAAFDEPLNLEIRAGHGPVLIPFSNSSGANVTGRSVTSTGTIWNIIDSPSGGSTVTSANFASVIQEIMNSGTWTTGNDIMVAMRKPASDTTTGQRIFSSFDDTGYAPTLNITYETPATAYKQTVGLRFEDIDIPQGTRITSATLEFVAAADGSDVATFDVQAEDTGHSRAFSNTAGNFSGRSGTLTPPVNWTPQAWVAGNTYKTSDDGVNLAPIVQDVVDNTNWCSGNAMSIFISGSGTRMALPYEIDPDLSPKLTITYDTASIKSAGCTATDLSYRVDSGSDDAEQRRTGSRRFTSSHRRIDLGSEPTNRSRTRFSSNRVGFRFNNIQIPANAAIHSAYLEFTARESSSNATNLSIMLENSTNPNTYSDTTGNNLLNRGTSGTVAWNSVPSWTAGVTYQSPDITSLVQAQVNKAGWNEGNAISFIIDGSGWRAVTSFNASAADAPRLVIKAATNSAAVGQTTRDKLSELVNDMVASGYTPITDTLYEAAQYYRGSDVVWGRIRGDRRTSRSSYSSHAYFRLSHEDSYTGGTVVRPGSCSESNLDSTNCINEYISGSPVYTSPITDECQSNHIVLLTDGQPTQNQSSSAIRSLTGVGSCQTSGYGACAEELAAYLSDPDQDVLATLPENQSVKVHTIGFNIDDPFLTRIADNGDGGYYTANSASELLASFNQILRGILNTDTTFVSPGVTVNAFNRLTHRDEIYYALFKPEESSRWVGNLKRYRISVDGDIKDSNDADAIDPDTGFFKESAQSFWSPSTDGNDTESGGAAANLPNHTNRKLYTYYAGSRSTTLSNAVNELSYTNRANISKSLLGIDAETDAYHETLLDWARGQDVLDRDNDGSTSDDRDQLSDPLHSVPYVVTYGGTDANPDLTIYYGDNEGFLHAIDAATGEELFAFIPEELLPNLNTLYSDSNGGEHPYGLDGEVNAWIKDENGDAQINAADGDHVYIYFGMRRGGNNYYALDVTDRNNPKILWTITGGSGDFTELGQTWSKPLKTKVDINGSVEDVLIFAGGYDSDQDGVTVRTPDDVGRAIYMVDAETGKLLWSAGYNSSFDLTLTDMNYSIPANIRAIDVNADGKADQMYVGDMGGQLWRFDINNGEKVRDLVDGGVIASIAGSTAANTRRFYNEPDVSSIKQGGTRKLLISIGSGYRAHPLNTDNTDRFYVFKQSDVISAPEDTDGDDDPDYTIIEESDLYDATKNLVSLGSEAERATAANDILDADGWYITMENKGEKILSSALTLKGQTVFTTYEPSPSTTSCTVAAGTTRVYLLNIEDGSNVDCQDLGDDACGDIEKIGDIDPDSYERAYVTPLGTIGPDATHIRTSGTVTDPLTGDKSTVTKDSICVATLCWGSSGAGSITKTYWYSE